VILLNQPLTKNTIYLKRYLTILSLDNTYKVNFFLCLVFIRYWCQRYTHVTCYSTNATTT